MRSEQLIDRVDLLQLECPSEHSVHAWESGELIHLLRKQLLPQRIETVLQELEAAVVGEDGGEGDLGSRILRDGSELAPRELVLLQEISGADEVQHVLQNEGIPQSLVAGVLVELFIDGLLSRQLVQEAAALVVEDE